jgi:hypothetical protein
VLGVNELDLIEFVFSEFLSRVKGLMKVDSNDTKSLGLGLGTLSLEKDKIEDELIPSFIIEEALYYYSQLEYYEVCKNIKIHKSK